MWPFPLWTLFVPSDAKQTHNKWATTVQKSFPDDDGGTIAFTVNLRATLPGLM